MKMDTERQSMDFATRVSKCMCVCVGVIMLLVFVSAGLIVSSVKGYNGGMEGNSSITIQGNSSDDRTGQELEVALAGHVRKVRDAQSVGQIVGPLLAAILPGGILLNHPKVFEGVDRILNIPFVPTNKSSVTVSTEMRQKRALPALIPLLISLGPSLATVGAGAAGGLIAGGIGIGIGDAIRKAEEEEEEYEEYVQELQESSMSGVEYPDYSDKDYNDSDVL